MITETVIIIVEEETVVEAEMGQGDMEAVEGECDSSSNLKVLHFSLAIILYNQHNDINSLQDRVIMNLLDLLIYLVVAPLTGEPYIAVLQKNRYWQYV